MNFFEENINEVQRSGLPCAVTTVFVRCFLGSYGNFSHEIPLMWPFRLSSQLGSNAKKNSDLHSNAISSRITGAQATIPAATTKDKRAGGLGS